MDGGDGCGLGCWIEGCGNGFLDPGEACEDSNNVAGDGCSIDCKSDESCGDGILDEVVDEVCDDGNDDDTDKCPATCEPARCGDGFVQRGIESCDDGNSVAEDGCTECILDSCGDAADDLGEECDQGAANGSDGSSCFRTCLTTTVVMEKSFDELVSGGALAQFSGANSATVLDVNGDGRDDAILGSRTSGLAVTVLGKGDGTLAKNSIYSDANSNISRSVLRDVNGDGIDDLVSARSNLNSAGVSLGTGDGFEFLALATTEVDVGGTNPDDLVVAELTGDSFLDVATANLTSNDVTILAGDGTVTFTATNRFGVQSGAGGERPSAIAAGDVTGDGIVNIVTANLTSSDVAVLAGLGGGAFAPPEIHSTVLGAQGTSPIALLLADVTNDGALDVVTANSASSDVTILAQQDGTLAPPLAFPTFIDEDGLGPRALSVGDVNKDGIPDLVTANLKDISVIPGLGAGVAFGPPHQPRRFRASPAATSTATAMSMQSEWRAIS